MDETGMPLSPHTPNIVTQNGQKKVHYRTSGKKEQITIIACANAAGQAIPPMIIFEGKYLNHEWTIGEVPGTIYGMSEKGWTDQELFMLWLKHFKAMLSLPDLCSCYLMDILHILNSPAFNWLRKKVSSSCVYIHILHMNHSLLIVEYLDH